MKKNSYLAKALTGVLFTAIFMIFCDSSFAKTSPKVIFKNKVKIICKEFYGSSSSSFNDAKSFLEADIDQLLNETGINISNVSISVENPSELVHRSGLNEKYYGKICASVLFTVSKNK